VDELPALFAQRSILGSPAEITRPAIVRISVFPGMTSGAPWDHHEGKAVEFVRKDDAAESSTPEYGNSNLNQSWQ
jgi:hypothetical protein